ncbi:hypothetical protein E2542_SST12192 [Spatholobus suberectus]|nr:hypothetical protein E2542_SST12192 [Spatholobus suberectus]
MLPTRRRCHDSEGGFCRVDFRGGLATTNRRRHASPEKGFLQGSNFWDEGTPPLIVVVPFRHLSTQIEDVHLRSVLSDADRSSPTTVHHRLQLRRPFIHRSM